MIATWTTKMKMYKNDHHPQEDFAKSDYRTHMKHKSLIIFYIFYYTLKTK
jgi:hypothetical protein